MNIAQGLVVNPVGMYRSFVRGRHTKNLYELKFTDELLEHSVGEYRALLDLETSAVVSSYTDSLAFAAWVLLSVFVYLIAVTPLWLPIILGALWVSWR